MQAKSAKFMIGSELVVPHYYTIIGCVICTCAR